MSQEDREVQSASFIATSPYGGRPLSSGLGHSNVTRRFIDGYYNIALGVNASTPAVVSNSDDTNWNIKSGKEQDENKQKEKQQQQQQQQQWQKLTSADSSTILSSRSSSLIFNENVAGKNSDPTAITAVSNNTEFVDHDDLVEYDLDINNNVFNNNYNISLNEFTIHLGNLNNIKLNLKNLAQQQDKLDTQLTEMISYCTELISHDDEIDDKSVSSKDSFRNSYEDGDLSDSIDSINSQLEVDLNYQISNAIKKNSSNDELVERIYLIKKIVDGGLNLLNDPDLKEFEIHHMDEIFIKNLTLLVDVFTNV
ncbi:hypothetical protein PACTADRAFT_17781 [Pachysolen tannophilus NRRL Y-2460]|uniref:Uncharacterized protein n=1 Tax=Pachysolen tannophilus NRRL Y-2460 TaxID=669874 RepID=A0A1E4TQJ2_PACTA|nr:hypothetical protein PACTADRAFT_17781 [Pachysolen tannophilus NRRL Y-2460]